MDNTNNFKIGKLGKHAVKHDARTLKVSNYLKKEHLPPVPRAYDWTTKFTAPWGMMHNDTLCDCTCAGAAHLIECWSLNASGAENMIQDNDVLNAYIALTGYNPQTGANDNGAPEIDALNYWRHNGIAGHKILAYASIDLKDPETIKQNIYLFGGIYIGLLLPNSINGQDIWDVPSEGMTGDGKPDSLGGHCVIVLAYDDEGLTAITWGAAKKMTWAFWKAYCDEAYAIISPDFFKSNIDPNAMDLHTLELDLLGITGEKAFLMKELMQDNK